jgi:hypothetical protein
MATGWKTPRRRGDASYPSIKRKSIIDQGKKE